MTSRRRTVAASTTFIAVITTLLLAAAPALATAPESPTTEPATAVTASSAILNGELNPNTSGTAGFQFSFNTNGTCTEGSTTPLRAEKEGEAIKVSTPVTGLVPGTEYTFCVLATHQEGETSESSSGEPLSFTTPAAPPAIDGESVSGVNATEATLEAQLNPNNQETTFVFEYAIEEAMLGTLGATKLEGAGPISGFGDQTASVSTGALLSAGTIYSYRVIAINASSEETIGPIEHFTTATPPQAPETTIPASAITTESAVLGGVLNPHSPGTPGTYEFLYRESPSECEGEKAAGSGEMTGAEGQAVEATIAELLPNATYTFCLLARNEAGETAVGQKVSFTALPVKATIHGEAAKNITATTADLTALINPNGSDTTYKMEYGATTEYGHETSEADAGAGRTDKPESQHITGLSANIHTYHWRLVARNGAGTATSVDHTFSNEAASPSLPDGRQYEMVTPPQKNGAVIGGLFGSGSAWAPRIAQNGLDLIAPNIQCFGAPESCTGVRQRAGEAYEFARTSQGWVTHVLAPSLTKFQAASMWAADADTHAALITAPGPPEGREHFYKRTADGELSDIGPTAEGEQGSAPPGAGNISFAATSDFSHLLYTGQEIWSLDEELELGNSLYEYAGTGNPRPRSVGVTGPEDSTTLISACGTLLGSASLGGSNTESYGSLSETGRTAYFTAFCGVKGVHELYARVDGETSEAHTVLISAPTLGTCTSEECQNAPAQEAIFAGASTDGSRVFFTSVGQLTDDAGQGEGEAGTLCQTASSAGCNLYESVCPEPCGKPGEEPNAEERELIDVSEAEGEKPVNGGARVQGVAAISPDGSHVYFVARGVLSEKPNAQGQQPEEGGDNLYVHAEGQPVTFIATLPSSDEGIFTRSGRAFEWATGIQIANVTPDGRFLVFLSHGALTPDDTRPEGPAQVYRYDDHTGALVRISIGEHGFNDNGNAGTVEAGIRPARFGWNLGVGPGRADPTMSHDGQFVFFESPVALTPGALNEVVVSGVGGLAENVYEYHDGEVSLISDGKDTTPNTSVLGIQSSVELLGSDASGANVFFATNDQLTSQDGDTQRDYYDARICTAEAPCFTPPASTSPCSEEACRGTAAGTPTAQTPGSESFTGAGNLTPPPPAPVVKPKPKTAARTRAEKLHRALRLCRKKHNHAKRAACERKARKAYRAAAKAKKSNRERGES